MPGNAAACLGYSSGRAIASWITLVVTGRYLTDQRRYSRSCQTDWVKNMNSRCTSALFSLTSFLIVTVGPLICHAEAQSKSLRHGSLKIDDSTPEAAIRSFYGALARKDSRSACQLLTTPDEMAEWSEVQAKTSASFKHLGTAAVARFGDEGRSLQLPIPAEAALRKLDTLKPTVNGNTAEWSMNPKSPMTLKRIDGHWKLDITFPSPAHLKQANDVHGRIAAFVDTIATDIDNGKLNSVADVREEIKRQREAMERDLANTAPAVHKP